MYKKSQKNVFFVRRTQIDVKTPIKLCYITNQNSEKALLYA